MKRCLPRLRNQTKTSSAGSPPPSPSPPGPPRLALRQPGDRERAPRQQRRRRALDLANHWIADRRLGTPEANRDSFSLLERAGEIPPDLADRLRAWAGFRYVLVHEYLEIDHAISYRALTTELGDLEAFARWAAGKLE